MTDQPTLPVLPPKTKVVAALAFLLYGLWAAFSVLQGKDFRYVVIGRWLERYLAQGAEAKEAET